MKIVSWNVNGIRAILGKGLGEFVATTQPDILCLQETKARPEQVTLPLELAGYHCYWNPADKPGYSGTAIFTRLPAHATACGMAIPEHDCEGRVLHAEFDAFQLVNVYTPNAQDGLRRLPYRLAWDAAFREYLAHLEATGKPVIFCGDLNVAHQEIDIARPKQNRFTAGFSDEERASFTQLLEAGFIDSFRHLHPTATDAYSWWSYRANARANNVGWRIDYVGLSPRLLPFLSAATIHHQVHGSDHCPVSVDLTLL